MFGIDMNPSSGETGATNALTGFSGFAGTEGEGLLSNDSALINSLLSGNEALTSKLLAPQISQISKNANEKTQTAAQFGTRSGGTNASNQNTMDTARSSVNDLISSLTGGAMGAAGSLGSNLLGMGMSGENDVFSQNKQEQQQRASKWDDIMKDVEAVAGGVMGGMGGGGAIPALDTAGGSDPLGLNAPPAINFGSYGNGPMPSFS